MPYKKVVSLEADKTIQLGGIDENGRPNPTKVEGYYLGKREIDGDFGVNFLHYFQTENGNVGVWGKTRLNSRLTSNLIGTMLLVTFTGMIPAKKKGRKPSYGYEVQYDEDNKIDVSGLLSDTEIENAEDSEYDPMSDASEVDPAADEEHLDEAPAVRAMPPKRAASTPDAERQAKVKALLGNRKTAN